MVTSRDGGASVILSAVAIEPTIAERIAAILAEWNTGQLPRYEVDNQIYELLTPTNIDEVVAATPDEWRGELMEHLRDLASDAKLISIVGGTFIRDGEVERREAAHAAYLERELRPAVRAWMRNRSERG